MNFGFKINGDSILFQFSYYPKSKAMILLKWERLSIYLAIGNSLKVHLRQKLELMAIKIFEFFFNTTFLYN
jgi:hypothetical protein